MGLLVADPVARVEMVLPLDPFSLSPTAYYRPESLSTLPNGSKVAQWNDDSGHGYHLTQASDPAKPVLVSRFLGGRSVLRFDGANTVMSAPATMAQLFGANGIGTVFMLVQIDAAASGTQTIWVENTAPNLIAFWQGGVLRSFVTSPSAQKAMSLGAWHLGLWQNDPAFIYAGVDDMDTADVGSLPGSVFAANLTGTLAIGKNGIFDPLLGYIAELIFFNYSLTELQRQGISAYFAKKYGTPNLSTSYGPWVEVKVHANPGIRAERGIRGHAFADRVASTGTMSFEMNNTGDSLVTRQSAYSPDHANWLIGFKEGTDVRLRITYDNLDVVVWRGTIEAILPVPGKTTYRVAVNCTDWMDEAATAKLSGQAVVLDNRSDQVFSLLVAAVKKQPPAIQVTQGADVYPYAFDNSQVESIAVMSEFQRLCMSEIGQVYVKGDGTVVFEGRRKRNTIVGSKFAFDDTSLFGLGISRARSNVLNNVSVEAHPRRKDTSNVVLFTLQNVPRIVRVTSYAVRGPYRDPNQKATRVGGMSMVTPASGTDFLFNSAADGTGTDLTAQLTVVATFSGNSVDFLVTNAGPADGYLTKLQARGLGLYSYETAISRAVEQASIDEFGERPYTLDMPYQADVGVAADAAAFVAAQNKVIVTRVDALTVRANDDDALMRQALTLEISDKVTVTESVTGLSGVAYFVNGVSLEVSEKGTIHVSWILTPADMSAYWILDLDGFTELDLTTVLGYGIFTAGWVLDLSTLASDTVVNP